MAYEPISQECKDLKYLVDDDTLESLDRAKLAVESAQGQAAFYARHPQVQGDAAMQARIDQQMASNPTRYRRVGEAAGADAAYELALADAMAQPAPGGEPNSGIKAGVNLPNREQLSAVQERYRSTGDFVHAARALGASRLIRHPELGD